mgnify:CR=1 FL=1
MMIKENNEAKVVVIGGGTGLSTMLRGLKQYTSHITAIVTVGDDGGGSGKLREDLGMLPPRYKKLYFSIGRYRTFNGRFVAI